MHHRVTAVMKYAKLGGVGLAYRSSLGCWVGGTYLGGMIPSMYNHDSTPKMVFTITSTQIMNMYPVTRRVLRQILSVCVPALAAVRNVKPS